MENIEGFIQDTLDLLEHIEGDLLGIEQGEADSDVIDDLFRHFHTLKGNAGMSGFGSVQEICHSAESALSPYRQSGSVPPSRLLEGLYLVVDLLRNGFQDAVDDEAILKEWQNKGLETYFSGNSSTHAPETSKGEARSGAALSADSERGTTDYGLSNDEIISIAAKFGRLYTAFFGLKAADNNDLFFTSLDALAEASIEFRALTDHGTGIVMKYGVYLEKAVTLYYRKELRYDSLDYELLGILIEDVQELLYRELQTRGLIFELAVTGANEVSALKRLAKEKSGIWDTLIKLITLDIPRTQLYGHSQVLEDLLELSSDGSERFFFLLNDEKKEDGRVYELITALVPVFPPVYPNMWEAVQKLR